MRICIETVDDLIPLGLFRNYVKCIVENILATTELERKEYSNIINKFDKELVGFFFNFKKFIDVELRNATRNENPHILIEYLKSLNKLYNEVNCKFSTGCTRHIWNQLNSRLLKWVKWEKGLYKMASVKWLKRKYKESPLLFLHWKLVHP